MAPHLAPHIHPAKLLACCKIFCKPHISSCTRVKNVTFSLSLVPHCHLIIACPFTCHPHVSNTSACKKLTITCLLSSLHLRLSLPSPYKSNLSQKTFLSQNLAQPRCPETHSLICPTVNLFTTYLIYSTSVNLFAAFSCVFL